MQLVDRALNELDRLAAFFEELDHTDECSADVVIALAQKSLLDEPIETLDVLLIDDFCQDSQRVCLDDIVLTLLDVLGQTGDHNEDFVLIDLELLDKDIDQASQSLMLSWTHLEKLRDVEEH